MIADDFAIPYQDFNILTMLSGRVWAIVRFDDHQLRQSDLTGPTGSPADPLLCYRTKEAATRVRDKAFRRWKRMQPK